MGSHTHNPGRRVLLRLLAMLAGTLLAIALAEAALRLGGGGPPPLLSKRSLRPRGQPLVMYHCYDSNPSGEMAPAPDTRQGAWELFQLTLPPTPLPVARLRETPFCVRYDRVQTASGRRLRGRAPAAEPAAGVRRILGLGDSFAYGEGVPQHLTLFAQMEALLGPGHEILNGARPGDDTHAEVAALLDLGRQFRADRALVVFIANDIQLSESLRQRQSRIYDLINIRDKLLQDEQARAWYGGRLRLTQLLGTRLALWRTGRSTVQWYLDSYDPRHNGENLAALARDLEALARVPGMRTVLVLYPLLEGLEGRYPLQAVHDRVAALARAAGLPVLDLAPAFAGMRTSSLWVHPTDHHPNGKAHAVAARAIIDWLRRQVPGFL